MLRVAAMADYTTPLAIATAATLNIVEAFQGGRLVALVADQRGVNHRALRRLLRTLVDAGLFIECEPETFAPTPVAQFLLDSNSCSLRGAYVLLPADIRGWGNFEHSLRTGQGAFERANGAPLWT